MLSVEFLFGMFIGWIIINALVSGFTNTDDRSIGFALFVGSIVAVLMVILALGMGLLGVWILG